MVSIIITTVYRVASYTANGGMISICYSYLYYVKETECMSKEAGCMSEIRLYTCSPNSAADNMQQVTILIYQTVQLYS